MRRTLAVLTLAAALPAQALEFPIGQPRRLQGMEVGAVYLQAVDMDHGTRAAEADIHLEADIRALAGNPNGFAKGSWIPYLQVHFELSKQGGTTIRGELMPMVASDGPHYGENLKLQGPGRYRVKFIVQPPGEGAHFGRHIDRSTGVQPWFPQIELEWEFSYAGIGKRGGY